MDTRRMKEAWERFQGKMRDLKARQLAILKRFSGRAEQEQIKKLQDGLK